MEQTDEKTRAAGFGYKLLGIISTAFGIGILFLAIREIGATPLPSENMDGLQWTWMDKLYFLHVPLVISMLWVMGGMGLAWQKSWAWHVLVVPAAVMVAMSIFLLLSSGDKRISAFLDTYLPIILAIQALSMGTLWLLLTASFRQENRIRLGDILIAALFACILLLDWFVSLYEGMARPF